MATKSINCPECQNDLWEMWGGKAQCTNCHYERPFKARQKGTDVTPSQLKRIEEIKKFFNRHREDKSFHICETEMLEDCGGMLLLKLETTDNPFSVRGGAFAIGRRGGLKIWYSVEIGSERAAKHYAEMLGGKYE